MAEYSGPATILYEGIPCLEIQNADIEGMSNDKPVHTMAKGRAGNSNGPEECSFNFESAIPAGGREIDFFEDAMNHVTRRFTIQMARKSRTVEGRFSQVREASGVDRANGISGSFSGKYVRAGA